MKFRIAHIVLLSVITLIVVSCANIGSPDGGAYDETPPKVVHTTPEFGSVGAMTQKIVLEFDENIKIDNAVEKVIVSPPQLEQPEISSSGKRITVELMDSVKRGFTYTIDFADAIEDNNEGNPMGDYAFTFSTGGTIDTMQISGYVLDARNLEPIKGIFVGLYALRNDSPAGNLPDSIFNTKPFERISRTDSRGHFIVKGLSKGRYCVYALKDQDQTYSYTQKSEMIAFNDKIIIPSCKPDIKPDTVWHDSIHYDSIVMRGYTHFYPDNIVLLAFNEKITDRYLLKTERPDLRHFTIFFTSPSNQLPIIEGLNFNSKNAFVVENNITNDTVNYWIRDSLIYNMDTLKMKLSYMGTDTSGQPVIQSDTIDLISKITKEKTEKIKQQEFEEWVKEYKTQLKQERKRAKTEETLNDEDNPELDATEKKSEKSKKNEDEKIIIPPMPEEFLELKTSSTVFDPEHNIDFMLNEPIDTVNLSCFHFKEKIDSLTEDRDFVLRKVNNTHNTYRLYAEWRPGHIYEIEVDTGAFVSIYGQRSEGFSKIINQKSSETYGSLTINLTNADTCAIVQLLDGSDKVVKEVKSKNGVACFYYLTPSLYYLRLFYDRNGNGMWDVGLYNEHRQAEEVYYYPVGLNIRANWDITQTWNPLSTPVEHQKPLKITKQKPEKKKTSRNRNAERKGGNKSNTQITRRNNGTDNY